jgi:hypothetical protein
VLTSFAPPIAWSKTRRVAVPCRRQVPELLTLDRVALSPCLGGPAGCWCPPCYPAKAVCWLLGAWVALGLLRLLLELAVRAQLDC